MQANLIINKSLVRINGDNGLIYITRRDSIAEKAIDAHFSRKEPRRLTWLIGDLNARSAVDILTQYVQEKTPAPELTDTDVENEDLEETTIEALPDTSSDIPQQ